MRADGRVHIWFRFGDKEPTQEDLNKLHQKLMAAVHDAGFSIYSTYITTRNNNSTSYWGDDPPETL